MFPGQNEYCCYSVTISNAWAECIFPPFILRRLSTKASLAITWLFDEVLNNFEYLLHRSCLNSKFIIGEIAALLTHGWMIFDQWSFTWGFCSANSWNRSIPWHGHRNAETIIEAPCFSRSTFRLYSCQIVFLSLYAWNMPSSWVIKKFVVCRFKILVNRNLSYRCLPRFTLFFQIVISSTHVFRWTTAFGH